MVRIENEIKLDYKDVLIRPKRSTLKSRNDVSLDREIHFKHSNKVFRGIPIVVANMDTTGTFEMAKVLSKHKMMVALHKHYSCDEIVKFIQENPKEAKFCGISAGTSSSDYDKITSIDKKIVTWSLDTPSGFDNIESTVGFICLDIANGYSEHFVECIQKYRTTFPNAIIMAGNVVTSEMTEQLILAGADIVKVGIGPGSVCTTRKQTGVGYPQLSAIIECADAAHGLGGLIVGDGGIKCTGDFCKGFGAGADFLMTGGMFAGFDESGGDTIQRNGKIFKIFYGMSSSTAMNKHSEGVANYRASEGKTVEVPYKGSVDNLVLDILGGLRSMCTYIGASSLKEVSKRCTFIRVTQQLNDVFGSANGTDMRTS
jgi:GMP reductase